MTAPRRYRLLFCLPTTALSGGVKLIFEIATGLAARGHACHVFAFSGPPVWYDLRVPMLPEREVEEVDFSRYDFVVASNAFLVPMLLPLIAPARPIFFTQDYEPYHHSGGGTRYEEFICDDEAFAAIYRLPVPILTEALAVRNLIRERMGKDAIHIPVGIHRNHFTLRPPHPRGPRARVLMVGNYLMPYKGMDDGFAALGIVNRTEPVELVLATQESRSRHVLERLDFPVDVRFRPDEAGMSRIYPSCDLYCCTSWYEGLGLPALEAFCCGLPVVSTRSFGVSDYGVDGVNLLLARPSDPGDLARTILRALTDEPLRERLRQGGLETIRDRYHWPEAIDRFDEALAAVDSEFPSPPAVDPAEMRRLLHVLEEQGNLTPIPVFRRFEALATEQDALLRALEESPSDPMLFAKVEDLRERLRPFLANPRAQYHRAFRARYDLCQLAFALRGHPRFGELLRRAVRRRA